MSLARNAAIVVLGALVVLVYSGEEAGKVSAARRPTTKAARPLPPVTMAIIPDPLPQPPPEPKKIRKPQFPLVVGSKGRTVKVLQRALIRSTYDPGPVDGRFGFGTQHAVYAFEKIHGLPLDGVVVKKQLRHILRAEPPKAPRYSVSSFVDVDITRQVLLEVVDGKVTKTLPVSTGNGAYYQSRSGLAIAHTPRGTFQIYSKVVDWKVGYLGAMYYPSYFNGGYAIHGSISVPPYPASHGCVRIPMHSTVGFFERNPVGTTIFVHD